jgi:hypothetical protein
MPVGRLSLISKKVQGQEVIMLAINPTAATYNALNHAFDVFNVRLFDGELPSCLVTLQRKSKAYGYFAGGRFGSRDGSEITDEIALNPSAFRERSDRQSLSTLAHEMAHLWQHHFGKVSRGRLSQQGMGGENAQHRLASDIDRRARRQGNRAIRDAHDRRGWTL